MIKKISDTQRWLPQRPSKVHRSLIRRPMSKISFAWKWRTSEAWKALRRPQNPLPATAPPHTIDLYSPTLSHFLELFLNSPFLSNSYYHTSWLVPAEPPMSRNFSSLLRSRRRGMLPQQQKKKQQQQQQQDRDDVTTTTITNWYWC